MEDLAGLNFSSPAQPKSAPSNQTRFPQNTNYVSPTPSRGLSPNYSVAAQMNGNTKGSASQSSSATKPDSFASLSAFSGLTRQGQNSNTSLEQQRLEKEKEKQEALEKQKRDLDMHFGANEFWEKHSRQGTPTIKTFDTYFYV
jgi:hypothetical protein